MNITLTEARNLIAPLATALQATVPAVGFKSFQEGPQTPEPHFEVPVVRLSHPNLVISPEQALGLAVVLAHVEREQKQLQEHIARLAAPNVTLTPVTPGGAR